MLDHGSSAQHIYNPSNLLDILRRKLVLPTDAALARTLEVAPPMLSKIRHRYLPVSASLLIRMHEVTGMSVRELRNIMGDRRCKYRLSGAQGRSKQEETLAA
jgi:plasmid maintenance system antidote protein VapI